MIQQRSSEFLSFFLFLFFFFNLFSFRLIHNEVNKSSFCADKIEVPECSFWQPKVKANVTDKHGGWVLINVDFDTPRNFNAEKIEVALEQNKSMIEWKYIGVVCVCLWFSLLCEFSASSAFGCWF